jgi:asparagine synthase (glutamine-hydrolysing)
MRKLSRLLDAESLEAIHVDLMSHWKDPGEILLEHSPSSFPPGTHGSGGGVEEMMLRDLIGYLPDDILTKVDRASMDRSLEVRVPLLDHRVVEFSLSLPLEMKIRNGETKWILRELLHRHVPRSLMDRPKMGFAVPVGRWLRGPLRDWAEALLDERVLSRGGIFRARPVREKWEDHLSGRRNCEQEIWDILMFQAWYERWHLDRGQARTDS